MTLQLKCEEKRQKNTRKSIPAAFVLVAVFCLATLVPAAAATGAKDIEVAKKAISFLSNPPSGTVTAAVIFDPANGASKAEAEAIAKLISEAPKAGQATLAPVLVPVTELDKLSSSKIAFVTGGLGAHHQAIARAAAANKVVTISTDLACAQAGHCVLGIATSPSVQILVSKAAADKTGASFSSAFLMLVREI